MNGSVIFHIAILALILDPTYRSLRWQSRGSNPFVTPDF
jgi:hypothetical protein